MVNYLERVASSAGRRAVLAKPPISGPPLLPAKDLSLPAEPSLPGDDQFFELRNQGGPERGEPSEAEKILHVAPTLNERPGADAERTELLGDLVGPAKKPAPDSLSGEPAFTVHRPKNQRPDTDSEATKLRGDLVEPAAKPAPDSLSSKAPLTVYLPKTLRPIADTRFQPSVASEQHPVAPSHAPARAGSTEFTVDKDPIPIVQSSADLEVKESAAGRQLARGSNKIPVPSTSHSPEPLPPSALPVPVPPMVIGGPVKPEQSRISIGSLEVMVENHLPVAPARPPASTSLRNEKANLERHYLDRFRLRR
jgi:hypothetical protein